VEVYAGPSGSREDQERVASKKGYGVRRNPSFRSRPRFLGRRLPTGRYGHGEMRSPMLIQ